MKVERYELPYVLEIDDDYTWDRTLACISIYILIALLVDILIGIGTALILLASFMLIHILIVLPYLNRKFNILREEYEKQVKHYKIELEEKIKDLGFDKSQYFITEEVENFQHRIYCNNKSICLVSKQFLTYIPKECLLGISQTTCREMSRQKVTLTFKDDIQTNIYFYTTPNLSDIFYYPLTDLLSKEE